jgi:hypothetical protein
VPTNANLLALNSTVVSSLMAATARLVESANQTTAPLPTTVSHNVLTPVPPCLMQSTVLAQTTLNAHQASVIRIFANLLAQ